MTLTTLTAIPVIKLLTIGILLSMLQMIITASRITLSQTLLAAWLLSLVGYVGIMLTEHGSVIHYSLAPWAHSVPIFFYLLTRSLFADRRGLAPVDTGLLIIALAWAFIDTAVHDAGDNLSLGFQLFSVFKLALVLLALIRLWLDRNDDLIEARRRLSLTIIVISGVYSALVIIVETIMPLINPPIFHEQWLDGLNSLSILALVLWVNGVLVSPSTHLYEWLAITPPKAMESEYADRTTQPLTDDPLTQRLKQQLEQGIYTIQGLSIGDLANAIRIPEYKCRQLINQRLGFRNFNDFLNHYRVQDAAKQLQLNPDQTITELALALGYRSLSTFNKAFKSAMGCTPSQYKSQSVTKF